MPDLITNNTLCPLTDYGLMHITGKDAKAFLQGQLSCDMQTLSDTMGTLACYCNHKGRMLATFYLWQQKDGYRLCLPHSLIANLQSHLKKYAVFSQVSFDVSNEPSVWGLLGPDSTQLISAHCPTLNQAHYGLSVFDPCQLLTLNHLSDCPRYLCVDPTPQLLNALRAASLERDESAWHNIDLLAKIFMAQEKTSAQFTPAATNFDQLGGVSVSKGCYVGQEIISRMHHLGQCKQALYLLQGSLEKRPLPGDSVTNDQEQSVGSITQSVRSEHKQLIQAVLNKTAADTPLFFQNQSLTPCPL